MLSHHRFLAILSILVLSIAIGSYFVYQHSHRCLYNDPVFCSFISNLNTQAFEEANGTFTTQQGEKASRVIWSLDRPNKQIQVVISDKESMNMVFTKDNVYVMDYRDGLWWQQSKNEMKKYIVDLDFDPEVFLGGFVERFKAQNVKIEKKEEVACGEVRCIRYRIGEQKMPEYIDIDAETSRLVRYAGQNGTIATAFRVEYKKKAIDIPLNTKEASVGQNVFLEPLGGDKNENTAEDLDFVKDFERDMKENGVSNH
ncbi:hypothetical protein BH09PAT2_BH09PAT2_10460 [soil metagenome]